MRVQAIVALLLISACAADTNELIRDAQRDGDWTAVNQRLDAEDKRRPSTAPACDGRQQLWCDTTLKETSCTCILKQVARDRVERITGQRRRGKSK